MLVLVRKPGESLTITPPGQTPIVITIIQVSGNRVRIGCEANRNVSIVRSEIDLEYAKRGAT